MFAAASLHLDADAARRANAAMAREGAIDWATFIPLAHRHGVASLLYQHLSDGTLDRSPLPGAAAAELHRVVEDTARKALLLTSELVALLDQFEQEGIRVVPLKGPLLAHQLYGSVALRRFSDLDLLVAVEDVERATDLIVRRGYVSENFDGVPDAVRRASHHRSLYSPLNTHRVELHYYLVSPVGRRRLPLSMIEGGLERVRLHMTPAWTLRPEELLVYLSIHGTKHCWERIEWVGAVAELLRSGRVTDWDRVNALARRLEAEGAVGAAAYLVRDVFGIAVPSSLGRGTRSLQAAARSVAMRLMADPRRLPSPGETLAFQVRTDSGLGFRTARLWSVLVVPTEADVAALPLPRALWDLYYVLRPLRLVVRWLTRSSLRA